MMTAYITIPMIEYVELKNIGSDPIKSIQRSELELERVCFCGKVRGLMYLIRKTVLFFDAMHTSANFNLEMKVTNF